MRWLRFLTAHSSPDEGKELAKSQHEATKQQREVADALVDSTTELAHESRHLLYANHFAESFRNALRGE